jgi:hypothetical protein
MRHSFSILAGNRFPQEAVGSACCARAASGHATAPPKTSRKFRRCMLAPCFWTKHPNGSSALIGAETDIKTIAAVHGQCRSWVISGQTITGENPLLSAVAQKRTLAANL